MQGSLHPTEVLETAQALGSDRCGLSGLSLDSTTRWPLNLNLYGWWERHSVIPLNWEVRLPFGFWDSPCPSNKERVIVLVGWNWWLSLSKENRNSDSQPEPEEYEWDSWVSLSPMKPCPVDRVNETLWQFLTRKDSKDIVAWGIKAWVQQLNQETGVGNVGVMNISHIRCVCLCVSDPYWYILNNSASLLPFTPNGCMVMVNLPFHRCGILK